MKIEFFTGEYRFLSNFFYPTAMVEMDGLMYPSVEHAYQAAKTLNEALRLRFTNGTAAEAKKMGRTLPKRPEFEALKVEIMYSLLVKKFEGTDLEARLLATGDAELVEGNSWGDTFWGVCNGVGQNMLGRLLMQVRGRILNRRLFT